MMRPNFSWSKNSLVDISWETALEKPPGIGKSWLIACMDLTFWGHTSVVLSESAFVFLVQVEEIVQLKQAKLSKHIWDFYWTMTFPNGMTTLLTPFNSQVGEELKFRYCVAINGNTLIRMEDIVHSVGGLSCHLQLIEWMGYQAEESFRLWI